MRLALLALSLAPLVACGPSASGSRVPLGDASAASDDLRIGDLSTRDMGAHDLAGARDLSVEAPDLAAGAPDLRVSADLAPSPDLRGVQCAAEADYGSPGAIQGEAVGDVDFAGNEGIFWSGDLPGGSATLLLELYAGLGKLSGSMEVVPGVYTIDGVETQYATCGVCLLLSADGDTYMATGGTVTLTSTSGRIKATIGNATFQHVDIDPNDFTSTPASDMCRSAVRSASINDVIDL